MFCGEKVFLLKNEKGEWVLPKGIIRDGLGAEAIALRRIHDEGGIDATIIDSAGRTYYEFYSITRQHPVCNRIAWFVMVSPTEKFTIGEPDKAQDAGFYLIADAMEMATYSQDKALLKQSYRKYCEKTGKTPSV